jgi:hypothetical protein
MKQSSATQDENYEVFLTFRCQNCQAEATYPAVKPKDNDTDEVLRISD